jgi:zinc transporter
VIGTAFVDVTGAELGLICGYRVHPNARASEIAVQDIADALSDSQTLAWLHFNLSDLRVRKWLQSANAVPEVFRDSLQDLEGDRKIEAVDDGMLLVTSDFSYDDADPADVNPLCGATPIRTS